MKHASGQCVYYIRTLQWTRTTGGVSYCPTVCCAFDLLSETSYLQVPNGRDFGSETGKVHPGLVSSK
eukprot:6209420-Pleurochrysis_carterae.AAC.1